MTTQASGDSRDDRPNGEESGEEETHFGFRHIPLGEKTGRVRDVFTSVARRYDLMNDLMSGGVHRLWKSALVTRLDPRPEMRILDLAGGTGDVARAIVDRRGRSGEPVTVCDLTFDMVQHGRDRTLDMGMAEEIAWLCGNAERLPFADMSFDACCIAFGLRNVARLDRALTEIRRVLRPGGHFLSLEFSRVVVPGLADLYESYSFQVLPRLGALVARDREAYEYLVQSIRRFPPQEELTAMLTAHGYAHASYRNLSGGIAAIHSAWRV